MAILLDDIAATNPLLLKRLKEDPELRQRQLDNLRQLLALASQAEKDGIAAANSQELENIRLEVVAAAYDKALSKGKKPAPAFSDITEKQVAAYWAAGHEPEFTRFFDTKVALLRASSPDLADRTVSKEERDQARDVFAKMQLGIADYERSKRLGRLTKEMTDRTELNVKLQRAQFLARAYTAKHAEELGATSTEIAAYLAAHPDLSPARKKAEAQKLLERARAGEDFAKLADQYSDDPGNEGEGGKKNGGAYREVPLGQMVKPFETAALALEAGQIAPQLVESDFGYHIIKLERKGQKDGRTTYDVRHILVGTTVPNPKPGERPIPLNDYAASRVEDEKEGKLVARLIAANQISVPADIAVPPVVIPARKKPRVKRKR
jgi:parvulin-like peptidyl-prolyl isomerase